MSKTNINQQNSDFSQIEREKSNTINKEKPGEEKSKKKVNFDNSFEHSIILFFFC